MDVEGEGGDKGKAKEEAGGALEAESVYRARELAELEGLVDPGLKNDVGCSVSGLYELVGAPSVLLLFPPPLPSFPSPSTSSFLHFSH
jgi:hypothetical protein